ncbi:unnamed protein product [Absidia cylindrospora]
MSARQFTKSTTTVTGTGTTIGIKRWTDGLVWSPSRIFGNFLIYRELDDRKNANDEEIKVAILSSSRLD